jgi:tetratricopeptide (TPR) repeat protein
MNSDEMNEQVSTPIDNPQMLSLMGYCIVSDAGQIKQGISMCVKAISNDPFNSDHYLNLGRIYILGNDRRRAIQSFKKGLHIRKDPRIIKELRQLGIRRTPPISSLPRGHFLNIITGKVLNFLAKR